jgi:hypothetical protein
MAKKKSQHKKISVAKIVKEKYHKGMMAKEMVSIVKRRRPDIKPITTITAFYDLIAAGKHGKKRKK